jgi:PadR family transcriptional regulator, regulatory protein PadR
LSKLLERNDEVLPGTLAMLILKALTGRAMHGAAVAAFILSASEGAFRVEEGALYPALHRLEKQGWVESDWGFSEHKRRAKFYKLTEKGAQELAGQNARWKRLTAAIARIMESA